MTGKIFEDLNNNGTYDEGTDTVLGNRGVFFDDNGDGQWQAASEVRVLSDAVGNFTIANDPTSVATLLVERGGLRIKRYQLVAGFPVLSLIFLTSPPFMASHKPLCQDVR